MTKKQLRPLPPDAKYGTPLIQPDGTKCKFVAKSTNATLLEQIIVEYDNSKSSRVAYTSPSRVFLEPLCYIGDDPVYPGGTVYNADGYVGTVIGNESLYPNEVLVKFDCVGMLCDVKRLFLTKPKKK